MLTLSILFVSGCSTRSIGLKGFGLPAFGQLKLDRSLPSPTGLKAVSSMTQVALEWKPIKSREIAGFRIFRSDEKGHFKLIETINDPYATHFTDTGLKPNRRYMYRISAFTDDGRVSPAAAITAPPTKQRLQAVPYFTAISGLPGRIKLIWRFHPDPKVTSYIVARSDRPDGTFNIVGTIKNRLSVEYIDKDVRPGKRYYYKLFGKTFDGVYTMPTPIVDAASKPLPPMITGVKATTNLPKRIEIIWKESTDPDFDYYQVYSSPFADGIYTLLAKTRANHYIDAIKEDGYKRYYKVTQVDKAGLESPKQPKPTIGMTLGGVRPPVIDSALIKNNAVLLRWHATDPRTKKFILVKKFWDRWRIKKLKITDYKGTTYTDKKIRPNVTYTYYVRAVDENGIVSAPSREVTVSLTASEK